MQNMYSAKTNLLVFNIQSRMPMGLRNTTDRRTMGILLDFRSHYVLIGISL